jgi:hypothetical protein
MAQYSSPGQPFDSGGWGDDAFYPPREEGRPGTFFARLLDPALFGQYATEPPRPPPGQWLAWLTQPTLLAQQGQAAQFETPPGQFPAPRAMAPRNPVLSPQGSVPLPRPAAIGDPRTTWRGGVLPLNRDEDGKVHFDTDAGQIGSAKRAAMMPGRVWSGEVDPNSNEAFETALELAGMAGLGPTGGALKTVKSVKVRAPMRTLEEHSAGTFDPPPRPQRPFEQDYRGAPRTDKAGNLTHDMDGDPLGAKHVVGRRVVGGDDMPLLPSQYDDVVKKAIGRPPLRASVEELGPDTAGLYRMRVPNDGRARIGHNSLERSIEYLKTLPPREIPQVIAHEMGHMIDDLAGDFIYLDRGIPIHAIPRDKLDAELKLIYNDLNNWNRNPRNKVEPDPNAKPIAPEDFGYQGADVFDEYMAEAVRAYIANPNYIKSVAPMTAEAIRRAVKSNPRLRRIIQFNASGVPIPVPPSPSDEGYWEAWKAGGVL